MSSNRNASITRAAALVALVAGCSDELSIPREPPDVYGLWHSSWEAAGGATVVATLELWQTRTSLQGSARLASVTYAISGSVAPDSTLALTFTGSDADFRFAGRLATPQRVQGRLVADDGESVDAVFTRQVDPAAPFLRAIGTWRSSWTDVAGSWTMHVTLEQISEQLIVRGGTLTGAGEPAVEIALEGGSTGPVDGTVGQYGGVRFELRLIEPEGRLLYFQGRFVSPTTVDGQLFHFLEQGSTQAISLQRVP